MEFAGFDAWVVGDWRGRKGGRQSSRRQSHRDIVPPIAIYIHPLSSQPYAFATDAFRSSPLAYLPTSRRTHPSHRPSTFCLFHYSHPSSRGLSLSLRRFPIYEVSTPLLTTLRHHCAFATIPQCSLGLRVGVGVCERENQAGERLSALLLPRRSLYIVLLQEECFFTSFFLEGSRVGIRRVRVFEIPRQFAVLRSTAVLALTHIDTVINISNVFKFLFYARFFLISLIFLRMKNHTLRFISFFYLNRCLFYLNRITFLFKQKNEVLHMCNYLDMTKFKILFFAILLRNIIIEQKNFTWNIFINSMLFPQKKKILLI